MKTIQPTRSLWLAGFLTALFVLAGCNTIEGAGRDVEAAGEAMSDTAEDVREGDSVVGD